MIFGVKRSFLLEGGVFPLFWVPEFGAFGFVLWAFFMGVSRLTIVSKYIDFVFCLC